MIQCSSSQLLLGNVNAPVKVTPASNWIVSPHLALFKAAWRLPPLFTVIVIPGAGVFAIAVETSTCGSAAGPSVVEAYKLWDAALRPRSKSERTNIESFDLSVAGIESTANSVGIITIHTLRLKNWKDSC
jgi:hypothetical protein